MIKAEEYIVRNIFQDKDLTEYVTKEDALRAIEIERKEMYNKFNSLFSGGLFTSLRMDFDSREGVILSIEIKKRT